MVVGTTVLIGVRAVGSGPGDPGTGGQLAAAATPGADAPTVASPVAATPAATATDPFVVVDIVGRDYHPKAVSIEPGTTVYWVNRDGNGHTASAVDGPFDSGNMSAGDVYEFTFDEPGNFPYDCKYHHDMGGTVIVLGD
jgi:plastocyanin